MQQCIPLWLYRLRFQFEAKEALHFPAFKSTNILRGAFGTIFRRIACLPECREPAVCPLEGTCPYEQVFAPIARTGGPSGFRDLPRPLVFRASHLDGRTVNADDHFWFDVHLFRIHPETVAFLTLSFAQFASEGIGPGRGRAVLQRAETIGLDGEPQFPFFANGTFRQSEFPEPLELLLSPPEAVSGNDAGTATLRVMFRTPTELKDHGQLVDEPAPRVLMARIFDRLVSLAAFYGKGTVPEDVALAVRGRLLSEAERLVIVKRELARVGADRLSGRTGRRHSLEGFAGHVEYTGPRETTEALLPWLRAGGMVGVGRQTVWGKGEIESGSVLSSD